MKFSKYVAHLFYIVLLFSNCVQEFDPPSQGYENLLIVESFLSDGDEAFEVKLSRSIPIDTTGFIPESRASVSLSDDLGESYNLVESTAGIYHYTGQINAQVGRAYQIHIQTTNGNQYESSPITMRKTPDIDNVRFEFQEKPSGQKGVQIYVNTHDDTNSTRYYRWEWEESWTFQTPYDTWMIWEDNQIKERILRINTCWKFGNSTSIEIATSKNLSSDNISDFPLLYVSSETDRLKLKYSLNVKQYALSEESYTFWNELKKITENLGTLFDPQPSIVKGNLYNINDDKEIVLGYFDASTVKEQRIFITSRDLPPLQYPNYFSHCSDSIVSYGDIPAMIEDFYILIGETLDNGFPQYRMSFPFCIDCTLYGTNIKPDYWD